MNFPSLNFNENLRRACRLCLEEKTNLYSLFSSLKIDQDSLINISEVIMMLTKEMISQEESLPQMICDECTGLVKSAYLFKLKYEESSKILKYYLESISVKQENVSEEEPEEEVPVRIIERKKPEVKRVKRKTEDSGSHQCPICNVLFSVTDFREHIRSHKALNKYLKVSLDSDYSSTRFYASPTEKPNFFKQKKLLHKCPYCNDEFIVKEFQKHLTTHHHSEEFKCDQCERVFKRLNHLNTHKTKHLKEYPYKCEECGKGFIIEQNFECHILTHKSEELPHECHYCLKRFSNPEHLRRHTTIHTENVSYSVKYKVCKCVHCLKSFKDKDELKSHICNPVNQSFNNRFSCKTCKKTFKYYSGLYNHNKTAHGSKQSKVLCSVCGVYVINIYSHMLRHSGEKPFKCDQCDKRFLSRPQLKQHLIVHSGLKPFVCSICAKAFNNLYNLQVHERIHAGNRCHICNVCNKGFLEKSYLKKHMNVHKNVS